VVEDAGALIAEPPLPRSGPGRLIAEHFHDGAVRAALAPGPDRAGAPSGG